MKNRQKYIITIRPKPEIYGFLHDCTPIISHSIYKNTVRKIDGCTFVHKINNDLWVIFGD